MATLSTAARNAALDAITALLHASGGPNLLVVNTVPGFMFIGGVSQFGSASSGRAEIPTPFDIVLTGGGTIRQTSGANSGLLIANGANSSLVLCQVGGVGSGADVEIAGLTAVAGQTLRFSSFALEIA